MHGRLITFEGMDGSGKSTQMSRTADWLHEQGLEVVCTREPGDTPLGAEIRRLLLTSGHRPFPEAELLLFLADRAQHVGELVAPALAAGKWVLCDRYSDSTLAYQMAGRRLDEGEVRRMLAFAELGVRPECTLWFDLPVGVGIERMRLRQASGEKATRLDDEAIAFHERVAEGFAALHQSEPQRLLRIDAAGSIEQVQLAVRAALSPLLPASQASR